MTIQEAIKSGKPFKRKDIGILWLIHDDGDCHVHSDDEAKTEFELHIEDILANDWEIKK